MRSFRRPSWGPPGATCPPGRCPPARRAGVPALPEAAQDRPRPRDRRAVRRPAGDHGPRPGREGGAGRGPGDPFFTIDHFRSFNAVLVQQSRLGELEIDELREVIAEAWACRAPQALVKAYFADG
ncbi:MAG: hypothetical protein R2734_21575 [Nocardioides sp.]